MLQLDILFVLACNASTHDRSPRHWIGFANVLPKDSPVEMFECTGRAPTRINLVCVTIVELLRAHKRFHPSLLAHGFVCAQTIIHCGQALKKNVFACITNVCAR